MSRESDFYTRMIANAPLMAILTGGVYTSHSIGRDGITRDSAPGAFDVNGYLKPSALVKQRGIVPDGQVMDTVAQIATARQVVEIWLYEDTGYTNIDAAREAIWRLFFGRKFSDSFAPELINVLDREIEPGQLSGASMTRLDWLVIDVQGD